MYAHTQVSTLPLVFVNIKPQNYYLNMTACLCVNQRILKNVSASSKMLINTTVSNIDNNKTLNQHIRMISEGLCNNISQYTILLYFW